jgi:hypothetical protein
MAQWDHHLMPAQGSLTERKKERQMRDRRKKSLIKKVYEMSALCDADVFLGIRIRKNGRVSTFCANRTGIWSPFASHLVSPPLMRCSDEN